ncbi:MAG: flagellar export chaperone FliS [Panacagrimonas sp.]
MSYASNAALQQYQNASNSSAAHSASPHQLIGMLLAGALDRIASARGCIARGDISAKLRYLGNTIVIVEHLRVCLDPKAGGQVAANLSALYDYMVRKLVRANVENDDAALGEVASLLRTIKQAWDAMPASVTRH